LFLKDFIILQKFILSEIKRFELSGFRISFACYPTESFQIGKLKDWSGNLENFERGFLPNE